MSESKKDPKKVDEKKIDAKTDDKELEDQELDKASGGSDHMHGYVIGTDGRVYPPCPD